MYHLIKKFEIFGLFGYQDVKLEFNSNNTVFIGNNGIGKTTILSMLYFILNEDVENLKKLEFDKFIIQFYDDNIERLSEEFTIHHSFLDDYLDQDKRSGGVFSRDFRRVLATNKEAEIIFEKIMDIYSNQGIHNDEFDDLVLKSFEFFEETIGRRISLPAFRRYLTSYCSSMKYAPLKKMNEYIADNIKNKYQILYFPTYRRIEEDLSVLKIEKAEMNNFELDFFDLEEDKSPKGELIQFGMQDVQSLINELLNTIKETAIVEFNKMTGELLNQYVSEKIEKNLTFDSNDIKISLNRVGSQISEGLTNQILQMHSEGTLNDNKYLLNFIINLIEKNKKLKPIDAKIESFVETCNSYLYNKKFIYDPSNVTLKLMHEFNKNKNLELASLSSGEKQIVSTFAKLFLTDFDNYIILFDEPELSLSIEWQEKLLPDIFETEKCKFSISITHSPNIVKNIYDNTEDIEEYITKNE